MDIRTSLRAKKSKLAAYEAGMKKAKNKGDLDGAKKWASGMVELRKEIISLTSQLS